MMKFLVALAAVAAVAVPTAHALDRSSTEAIYRLAQSASGLKARESVRVVVEPAAVLKARRVRLLERAYPLRAQSHDETVYRALGLLTGRRGVLRTALVEAENATGLYDPAAKTAYLRAGKTARAAGLHELVHALQDQHFGLGRVFRLPGGSDASVAALAVVEGHAGLVSRVVAPSPRSLQSHGGPRLTRFLELQKGFVYDVGLRFVANLRNLGGRPAVFGSLRRLPATTEQVFHLDKYLEREPAAPIVLPVNAAGFELRSTNTFGELDVRALLAVFGVPRLDHVGTGWGGGRSAVYRGPEGEAVAVALEWDTASDAAQWAEAVATWVNEAFHAEAVDEPPRQLCAASACWLLDGRSIAFERTETRTALVIGTDLERAAELALAVAPS